MDFDFSDEQQLIRDSVGRFVRDEYDFAARRALAASDEGFSRQHWATFAELGWLAVALPEDLGGFGGGPVETMIIMEEIGRGLVLEPYLPTVVLGGGLLARHGSDQQRQELLGPMAEGRLMLALAQAEPQGRFNLADVATTAKPDGDGYVLDGRKAVVVGGHVADRIVVPARTSGGRRERDGITLFLVDADADGVTRRCYATQDALRACDLTLEGVRVEAGAAIGPVDGGLALLEEAVDHGIAALAAEAVGAMQAAHEQTLDYARTRRQFGVPLAKFQVLQHRMADMFIHLEEARSLAVLAALKLGAAPEERARACAMAKVQVANSGRFVGQQAIQIHGGMGMTDEMPISHYFKRLVMIDVMFGNGDWHLKRVAAMA